MFPMEDEPATVRALPDTLVPRRGELKSHHRPSSLASLAAPLPSSGGTGR